MPAPKPMRSNRKELAEREGFEPGKDPLQDQQVTDSKENPVPVDPPESP